MKVMKLGTWQIDFIFSSVQRIVSRVEDNAHRRSSNDDVSGISEEAAHGCPRFFDRDGNFPRRDKCAFVVDYADNCRLIYRSADGYTFEIRSARFARRERTLTVAYLLFPRVVTVKPLEIQPGRQPFNDDPSLKYAFSFSRCLRAGFSSLGQFSQVKSGTARGNVSRFLFLGDGVRFYASPPRRTACFVIVPSKNTSRLLCASNFSALDTNRSIKPASPRCLPSLMSRGREVRAAAEGFSLTRGFRESSRGIYKF